MIGRRAIGVGWVLLVGCGPMASAHERATEGAAGGSGSDSSDGTSTSTTGDTTGDPGGPPPDGDGLLLAYVVELTNADGFRQWNANVVRVWETGDTIEEVAFDVRAYVNGPSPHQLVWSPAGGHLLVREAPGSPKLFLWSTDGVTHVLEPPGVVANAMWSGTGDAIVTQIERPDSAELHPGELMVFDLRETPPLTSWVDEAVTQGSLCTVTADGEHVFFGYLDGDYDHRVARLDRSIPGMPSVYNADFGAIFADCDSSADGDWLSMYGGHQVHIVSLDGDVDQDSIVASATAVGCGESIRSWAPTEPVFAFLDQRSIVGHPCRGLFGDVWTTDVWLFDLRKPGKPQPVMIAAGEDMASAAVIVGWAETAAGHTRLTVAGPGPDGVRVVRVVDLHDGVDDVATIIADAAVVAPDGAHLVYSLGAQLYLAPVEGGQPTEIGLTPPGKPPQCAWSPDSDHVQCALIQDVDVGTTRELWSFTLTNQGARAAMLDPDVDFIGRFSRDAKMLAYARNLTGFDLAQLHFIPYDDDGPRIDARFSIDFERGRLGHFTWQP